MQPAAPNLDDPSLYLNRDLSWLEFNRRVLEEAQDPTVPMLERLKFLAIFSSNLDEFFMVRVGGIQQKVQAGIPTGSGADQLSPALQLDRVRATVKELVATEYRCLLTEVLPALQERGIVIRTAAELTEDERTHTRELFRREIFPILTPLATDPAHPFPHLLNKSLNVAVSLKRPGDADPLYAVVQVPGVMQQRFVPLPAPRAEGAPAPAAADEHKRPQATGAEASGVVGAAAVRAAPAAPPAPPRAQAQYAFVPLEDVIRTHLADLFPGMELGRAAAFRVTRDSEYELDDEVDDLLEEIEAHVRARRRGLPVRLEIEAGAPPDIEQFLTEGLRLNPADVYQIPGPLDLGGLFQICGVPGYPELRDPPFVPLPVTALAQVTAPWPVIRARDILMYHPYESFAPVVDFIEAAAADERVLAIKQTLYRTSSDSPIVRALQRAADRGKQVTAVIELKARMDEERNIIWAKELEKAGVHVVFGFVGLKTHCKVALVVRRDEDNTIRRYVHLATGNYNPQTARVYTDIGLFTGNSEFADDVSALFNYLTGYAELPQWRKLLVAPSRLQTVMIEKIEREAANQRAGKPARLLVKVNGILEPAVVKALYRASEAGVKIDICCRGICSLRPGVPGVSDTIRVTSVVDRFLEHTRIFYFENAGTPEVYVGSADWMDRNLSRRVEVVFPIEQPDLKQRVIDILKVALADNVKARELLPDGTYRRVKPAEGVPPLRSQQRFMEMASEAGTRAAVPAAAEEPVIVKPRAGKRSHRDKGRRP
ncbi:polyphosphate kinase : Polyphosphate kinase OS=Cyanobacterium stanieri (strain ATCC 29140 / PCC 7202) GN=ppk PE=3 SV=1: PP_kinase_N: PP_kinase: PP_kinase_C [Gemmataceae bacterium]|nr:polyphosphate kinase : Polyphosphate kinase OS=Cyanobacterium stanieri (strain ATCC 29140 / PCC 7202) GN=ppk PE=3 SV=1: PP_kinase_N: PP_kinase: PP_kinase_C [Gemmataceae bacterium]VTU00967.1 polyphosphate kinase : Polyphosphate kinase OS=Cyanobacterium stanieri (strain ATCC 29140 / PCC 7202) GN=ppk PE=3 SV=1: PP_kinase_N: PP_kinase: PP_kinase_C [Gemmataceae bacterium]